MSLDFDIAPHCKGKRCTNLLTSWVDFKNGYCDLCIQEKWDEEKERKRASDAKTKKE